MLEFIHTPATMLIPYNFIEAHYFLLLQTCVYVGDTCQLCVFHVMFQIQLPEHEMMVSMFVCARCSDVLETLRELVINCCIVSFHVLHTLFSQLFQGVKLTIVLRAPVLERSWWHQPCCYVNSIPHSSIYVVTNAHGYQ